MLLTILLAEYQYRHSSKGRLFRCIIHTKNYFTMQVQSISKRRIQSQGNKSRRKIHLRYQMRDDLMTNWNSHDKKIQEPP